MNKIHPLVALQELLNIGMLHSIQDQEDRLAATNTYPSAFSQWRTLCLFGAYYFWSFSANLRCSSIWASIIR